jgi:hypothetical protein
VSHLPEFSVAVWITAPVFCQLSVVPTGTWTRPGRNA